MARNSVRTSRSVASKASKALRSGKTSKTTKSLAASVLSNRRPKWPADRECSCTPGFFERVVK